MTLPVLLLAPVGGPGGLEGEAAAVVAVLLLLVVDGAGGGGGGGGGGLDGGMAAGEALRQVHVGPAGKKKLNVGPAENISSTK